MSNIIYLTLVLIVPAWWLISRPRPRPRPTKSPLGLGRSLITKSEYVDFPPKLEVWISFKPKHEPTIKLSRLFMRRNKNEMNRVFGKARINLKNECQNELVVWITSRCEEVYCESPTYAYGCSTCMNQSTSSLVSSMSMFHFLALITLPLLFLIALVDHHFCSSQLTSSIPAFLSIFSARKIRV